MRLLLIALFVEIGLVLTIVPWSGYWERNYFAETWPLLHAFITNNFIRGAVSGLGLLNLAVAFLELFALFAERRPSDQMTTLQHPSVLEDK